MQSEVMFKKIKNILKSTNLNYILLIPFVTLLALELFYFGNFFSVISWIFLYPISFFLSYILMFGLINVFYVFPRKLYLASTCILLGFFSMVGYISRQKLIIKGSPLVPSDFTLGKEAIGVSGNFQYVYISLAIIVICTFLLMYFILKRTPKEKYKWLQKIIVFLLAVTFLIVFRTDFRTIQHKFSLQLINWSQKMNYDRNGMMLGFILNAEYLKVAIPADYKEDVINQIIGSTKATYAVDPDFKPNIIIIMSEAFWDSTLLKNVKYNQDPIPYFHSLQESQTSGIMIAPVYGGGTANTEFEALTGFSTQFLASDVMPYAQYINKPVETLATVLKRQGYAATAIHTYDDWFYNRNTVYKYFGFDKFISKEFFNSPERVGDYIRDTELSKKILDEINETDQPDFIFAVSMQNHGPYTSTENSQNTIKVIHSDVSPASVAILENYTSAISDVDQSLRQLINGLKQIDQPTEVIFFGDHLPMLGDNYSVYQEAGFIKGDNSYQDFINLHSVPFVTWNNFSTTDKELRLSSNFIGTYALELAKKSGSPMTDFLSTLMKNGSDVVINQYYLSQEKITPIEVSQYILLQYDLLLGNEYTYLLRPGNKPLISTGYLLGDGPVKITSAELTDGVLTIHGDNFVENDKVYINDEEIRSTFDGNNTLSANLTKKYSGKSSTLKIQIKLFDSMKKVIAQSNIYSLQGSK